MNTITTITTMAMTATMRRAPPEMLPCWLIANIWLSAAGRRATMPAKMSRLMPLPTPRLVICSPSHIRNMVPPVRVAMVDTTKNGPGFNTRPWLACRPSAIADDWNSARITVR